MVGDSRRHVRTTFSRVFSAPGSSDPASDPERNRVVAVGATVVVDADTIVRAGINWGTQPGRAETTSPLLSGIDRLHFTAGFSRRLPEYWTIFAGIEVLRPESLDYFNPEQPFGPSTLERRYVALSLALSRAW